MNNARRLLIAFVLSVFYGSMPMAMASDTADSSFNFQDAATVTEGVAQITAALKAQGMQIVRVIDHAAAAAELSLPLRPTTVILFTDPKVDTRLIQRSQTTAIDLPQKILVWEAASGEIQLSYNPSGYLADRHRIVPRDQLLRRVTERLSQFGPVEDGLVSVESRQSVEATVVTLRTLLAESGFGVLPTIDHQAIAQTAHQRRLRPTQLLIFGNPTVGTRLMQNRQTIGIDLPLKFLIWEDRQGKVFITYNDPQFIGSRHNIQGLDEILANIARALANFASQTAQPAP